MTREEMIEQLENTILLIKQNGKDWWDERDIPILHEAIKAMKTEPCEDCISRQTVIDYVLKDNYYNGGWFEIEKDKYVEWLKALPSVQPKQRWTPVSERLPKSSGVYIVSRWFSDGFEIKLLADACYFDGSTWYDDNRINHNREIDKNIVAWMPLPEPYKAESEDKE